MHPRRSVPQSLHRLAQIQSGVISRDQALGSGVSPTVVKRLLRDGVWGSSAPGIYSVPNTEPDWLSQVWAGVLLGGSQARAAGTTAASLHELIDTRQLPIEVLVPVGRQLADRPWVTFRQERPGVRAVSGRAEPPRTRIEDTVLDLCATGTPADCVSWVTGAMQRRLTSPEALGRALTRRSRMPHRRLLIGLLSDVATGVHSALERRYQQEVERAHGLPTPERQRSRPGRNVFVDVAYRQYLLIIELDGRVGHVGQGRHRDRRRDNEHATSGALTLRFGWEEVTGEPCAVARDVAEVLVARGWSGFPVSCPGCR